MLFIKKSNTAETKMRDRKIIKEHEIKVEELKRNMNTLCKY